MKKQIATIAIAIAAVIAINYFTPHDDTDPPGERSGLVMYRDALTGCEYLAASNLLGATGITPRLGYNGEQICRDGKGKPFGDDDIAADPAGNGWVRTQSAQSQSNSNSSGASGGNASVINDAGGNADNRPEYHLPWTKQPDGSLACEDNAAHRKEHGIPQGGNVQVWCGPDEEGL